MSCVHQEKSKSFLPEQGVPQTQVWFDGSVSAAFKKAKLEDKAVFLYWGALWCPPCNELKEQVFMKSAFAEQMKNFVPVYLDGDTDRAQQWGEKFSAAGYPTVLVMNHDQKEILRLSGTVDIAEFSKAIDAVIASRLPLNELILAAERGDLNNDQWQSLAAVSWEQIPEGRLVSVTKTLEDLLKKVPEELPQIKASLAAAYLSEINQTEEAAPAVEDSLSAIFANHDTLYAARYFLTQKSPAFLRYYENIEGSEKPVLQEKFLEALRKLGEDSRLSVDTSLWTLYPAIAFAKKDKKIKGDQRLKADVLTAVEKADQRAQSDFERHAVISGAAYLLAEIEEFKKAKELLQKEIKTTNTPWYYYSGLARIATKENNKAERLKWTRKASEVAEGRASRLQWLASDLLLHAELDETNDSAVLRSLTEDFYNLAFELGDGFVGRNRLRADRVAAALQPWLKNDSSLRRTVQSFQERCRSIGNDIVPECQSYFTSLV